MAQIGMVARPRQYSLCRHRYRAPSFWGCSLAFPDQVKHKQSTKIAELERVMHPWHLLVCELSKTDLLASAANFVRKADRKTVSGPRDLPNRGVTLLAAPNAAASVFPDADGSGMIKSATVVPSSKRRMARSRMRSRQASRPIQPNWGIGTLKNRSTALVRSRQRSIRFG
jgi:hypothetical protein